MRLTIALFVAITAFGQQAGRGSVAPINRGPVAATPQQAQGITLQLNGDLATSIETARLNTKRPDGQPLYPDIQSFMQALLKRDLQQIVRQYPPASLKAKHDAVQKAAAEAAAAEALVVGK